MKQVIVATKNAGKAKEFEHIFNQYNVVVKSLLDFEVSKKSWKMAKHSKKML